MRRVEDLLRGDEVGGAQAWPSEATCVTFFLAGEPWRDRKVEAP